MKKEQDNLNPQNLEMQQELCVRNAILSLLAAMALPLFIIMSGVKGGFLWYAALILCGIYIIFAAHLLIKAAKLQELSNSQDLHNR